MKSVNIKILLADDDQDDCMFFEDAVKELSLELTLDMVHDGADLMDFLQKNSQDLPHLLFLDLNMPKKTGIECLSEIKKDQDLSKLPVVMYSTSSNPDVMESLYKIGAQFYIRKPADFSNLKSVIRQAISNVIQEKTLASTLHQFEIKPLLH
jgi:CheY-like chemotaxis protein